MNGTLKKALVMISVLLFLTSAVSTAYAVSISKPADNIEDEQKSMTIYRYAPDGSVEPIQIDVDEDIEDLDDLCDSFDKTKDYIKSKMEQVMLING